VPKLSENLALKNRRPKNHYPFYFKNEIY